jgi:hypothetical protein
MGYGTWPELGPYPDPIEEHASKLKEDIKGFDSFSAYNRDPMPAKTYRTLMNSLTALCDKILRQPTPTQLHESIENESKPQQPRPTTPFKRFRRPQPPSTLPQTAFQPLRKPMYDIEPTGDRRIAGAGEVAVWH